MTLAGLISGFVRRHWAAYAASALMLVGVALLTVWLPRQVGLLVDGLVAQRLTREALAIELLKLLAAGAAIYGLRVGWRLKLYAAAYRLGVELRERLYRRLTLQGPPFFQQRRTGDLMANATNDIDAIELAAGEAMLAGFDGSLTLLLVVAAMALVIDPWLALVAMLPFPPMALAFWWISRHLHDASRDALDCFSRLNDHAQETLSGVRTLRALGLEQRSSTRFAELADAAARASERAQRWEATYEPAVGISLTLAVVLTLGYGGWRVWQGELTIGELTSFNLYLSQLIWPMFAAGWVLSLIGRGRAAWGRLQPVIDAPLTLVDDGRAVPQRDAPIRAEQLRFAYPGQARPALDGVSFDLPAGRTLGLVGPTGAGKSSVLKLLLRQWDPQSGQLHWGDAALPSLSLRALRDAVAWVPQEAFLFSASVAQNIALAKPGATREEVVQAARLAALDEDIQRLPQGLRHARRRTRRDVVGRPAPARGDRPCAARRSAAAAARRRAERGRHADRIAHPGPPARAARRAQRDHRQPPAQHRDGRRPDPGVAARPCARTRHPRRTRRPRRLVRDAVAVPATRAAARRTVCRPGARRCLGSLAACCGPSFLASAQARSALGGQPAALGCGGRCCAPTPLRCAAAGPVAELASIAALTALSQPRPDQFTLRAARAALRPVLLATAASAPPAARPGRCGHHGGSRKPWSGGGRNA